MQQNTGLTIIDEEDVRAHINTAQSLVTRFGLVEEDPKSVKTPLAGTGRRFVSTVSTSSLRRSRQVELSERIAAINTGDVMLSIKQHTVLFDLRRALAVGLAVGDIFSRQTTLEVLQKKNKHHPLEGSEASEFKSLLSSSAYISCFTFCAFLLHVVDGDGEPADDTDEPVFEFSTPQDALKHLLSGYERALETVEDDGTLVATTKAYARTVLDGLLQRRQRFDNLNGFSDNHMRLEADDFVINGFDVPPSERKKPLAMSFKKPDEIVGNHIAKYQAMRLARMVMAYDFERQMNPFVELGGFLFTFIGDGMPGTGKTMLIQMTAGLINDYCHMAGYGFHYENFGVDQISSYQGKSGQNCKNFINNVMSAKTIGFGTIDDIDQVAAKRSDDRASAGQQEVTAVLMESFAGASTVVRGNCTFGMFSNYPENVDDALRQRAGARWLVDGPQTENDYVDIFMLLAGKNHSIPSGKHDFLADQEIKKAISKSYEKHALPQEDSLIQVWDRYQKEYGTIKTMQDVGRYLYLIKKAEPRFTGRAIKNITDAIKMRAMDVDLPDEWFETPEVFLHRGYDEKMAMIDDLRGEISLKTVLQEINRYADSEFRYTDKSDSAAVEDIIRQERQRQKAALELSKMKQDGRWNLAE